MPKIIEFADGFSSASAPDIEGGTQEVISLLNNQTGTAISELDFDGFSSVFIDFEVHRFDDVSTFRQVGTAIFRKNPSTLLWSFDLGNYTGDSIIEESISSPEHIVLSIDGSGQVSYDSGNMGSGHTAILKIVLLRFLV